MPVEHLVDAAKRDGAGVGTVNIDWPGLKYADPVGGISGVSFIRSLETHRPGASLKPSANASRCLPLASSQTGSFSREGDLQRTYRLGLAVAGSMAPQDSTECIGRRFRRRVLAISSRLQKPSIQNSTI